jgi:hypothetical protein
MGRTNDPAPPGHNGPEPLNNDERADLIAYFGDKIRRQQRVAAEAKAAYDIERTEVNSLFALVKGDLQISRKEFESVLAAGDMTEAEFRHAETKRTTLFQLAGLPVGAQIDLFPAAGDTADDVAAAYKNGRRAGLRGDDPTAPDTLHPSLVPEYQRGWSEGQGELGERMVRAAEIIQRRGQPDASSEAVDLNKAEEEDPGDPAVLKKKAAALKKAGFMDKAPVAEPELEAVH